MKNLHHYTDEAISAVFEKHGAFFAFSDKQYRTQAKEGIVYVSMGAGLCCPMESAKAIGPELTKAREEGLKKQVEENSAKDIISHAFFNHECGYTGDTEPAMDDLYQYQIKWPEIFTQELIDKVFGECFIWAYQD